MLVTRPAARAQGLAKLLEQMGASVEARPTIALARCTDPGPAKDAVSNLQRYAWIVFTSRSGARFFLSFLDEVWPQRPPIAALIAAVGPGTALELAQAGLSPELVPRQSSAQGLAAALQERLQQPRAVVLIVRPETQLRGVLADSLRAMGACPEEVAFYRNVPDSEAAAIARDVKQGRYDVVIFSSPSTLERLLAARPQERREVREALERSRLVAIGEVTARALAREGLRAGAIASEPTDEALARAVLGDGWYGVKS